MLLGAALSARAQPAVPPPEAQPARTIRLLVPFAPGGPTDALGRAIADAAGRQLGTGIAVENRGGAGGLLSNEACARAAPDGLTLCIGSVATHSILPHVHPGRVGADPAGFTPIMRIAEEASLVVLRSAHPATDLAGFTAWARGRDLVHVGASGVGSAYLMFTQVAPAIGMRMEPVMYRGGNTVLAGLLSGEVPVAIGPVSLFLGPIRSGLARPVVVMGPVRSRVAPEVPTVAESLIENFGFSTYTGLFGPAGMAPAVVARIEAAVAAGLNEPATRARLEDLGFELTVAGSTEFAAWLAHHAPSWRRLVDQNREAIMGVAGR
jgi:tripartite-type tricarboxylate transporter receptor subunit TctC